MCGQSTPVLTSRTASAKVCWGRNDAAMGKRVAQIVAPMCQITKPTSSPTTGHIQLPARCLTARSQRGVGRATTAGSSAASGRANSSVVSATIAPSPRLGGAGVRLERDNLFAVKGLRGVHAECLWPAGLLVGILD